MTIDLSKYELITLHEAAGRCSVAGESTKEVIKNATKAENIARVYQTLVNTFGYLERDIVANRPTLVNLHHAIKRNLHRNLKSVKIYIEKNVG
jgi:hypothetical protein